MDEIAPLQLERRLSRRLWGGRRLAPFLGVAEPDDGDPYGEAWLVYAGNEVLGGRWAGRTLQEVADALGERLVGTASAARYGTRFPLLAKFIDAADRLSIQVHPDDLYARRFEPDGGHLGKSEAWLVLDAAPDAEVVHGFREDVRPHQVRTAVRDGSLERLLRRVPVRPGDVVYNPAGTVHAVGAGIFLFEIQQSSDLTYRLYDYARRGADGRLRELHVDRGLEVADLRGGAEVAPAPRELGPGRTELVRCEHFVLENLDLAGEHRAATRPASLEVLTVVEGGLELHAEGGGLELRAGDAVVLPAALGSYRLAGRGRVLRSYLPEDAEG